MLSTSTTIPEAFTYYDMRRRIAAQVPDGVYALELQQKFWAKDGPSFRNEELVKNLGGFHSSGEDSVFRGKNLDIPWAWHLWLWYHFVLHGHTIPMSRTEYEETKVDLLRFKGKIRYQTEGGWWSSKKLLRLLDPRSDKSLINAGNLVAHDHSVSEARSVVEEESSSKWCSKRYWAEQARLDLVR
ncbi:hypothetical protein BDD12DRAFT_880264 [Trichophaea hybrida]|nr:hypothetical protein BDD12DRAFT_880264 [Trichophaea hybrida]